MPHDSIELTIHGAILAALEERKITREQLARLTREEWKKGRWTKLKSGPEVYCHAIDKLAWVARHLGFDVALDGTCTPAGRKQLPNRHAVPLAA
ncbi:hypothetical protein BV511_15690 [Methylorubrum extorquens]|uniref:hypothetical protein n=1 Tax=Methylorubrum extorquens TaxID=408 RepID=UPI00097292B3|nr:hypothetical protein [Methylorubrum extorquens]APX86015.1 hypothetical protein BV511_15690 [Methylorubrum extorquens]